MRRVDSNDRRGRRGGGSPREARRRTALRLSVRGDLYDQELTSRMGSSLEPVHSPNQS